MDVSKFLDAITRHERKKREAKSIEKRTKWCRFPFLKQLIQLSLLEQPYNLVLLGPPSVGKTFWTVGLGLEAVQRGYRVFSLQWVSWSTY